MAPRNGDELPRRLSGQLLPTEQRQPLGPLWFEDDPELLRRVRDGLINLPATAMPLTAESSME